MTIDCDIRPGVPDIKALLPYLNDFWQGFFSARDPLETYSRLKETVQ